MKNCTPLLHEAHLQAKMCKKHTGFSLLEVRMSKNLHAALAPSAISQNAKKTDGLGPLFEVGLPKNGTPLLHEAHLQVKMPAPGHFLQFRCRKMARCSGAKQIFKSKCTKHRMPRPILDVQLSKNARRCDNKLYKMSMHKTPEFWSNF